MNTITYPAFFYIWTDNTITVVFPDLNDWTLTGNNIHQVYAMAEDAILDYLVELKQTGKPIPAPSENAVALWNKYDPFYAADWDSIMNVLHDCYISTISVDIPA